MCQVQRENPVKERIIVFLYNFLDIGYRLRLTEVSNEGPSGNWRVFLKVQVKLEF